jgi:ribosomal protein L32E
MDISTLREAAIEAANRALYEKHGFVPSEESDEWEDEYRRQFATLKQRYGNQVTVPARPAVASGPQRQLPELRGTPEEQRWGASIREERLREIPSEAVRAFWVETWPRAKQWIDTRDVPTQTMLQRLKPQYDEWRKKQAETAAARKAEAQKKAAETAAYQRKLKEAGVTPEGLVELVDASERFDPAQLAAKLAPTCCWSRRRTCAATTNTRSSATRAWSPTSSSTHRRRDAVRRYRAVIGICGRPGDPGSSTGSRWNPVDEHPLDIAENLDRSEHPALSRILGGLAAVVWRVQHD